MSWTTRMGYIAFLLAACEVVSLLLPRSAGVVGQTTLWVGTVLNVVVFVCTVSLGVFFWKRIKKTPGRMALLSSIIFVCAGLLFIYALPLTSIIMAWMPPALLPLIDGVIWLFPLGLFLLGVAPLTLAVALGRSGLFPKRVVRPTFAWGASSAVVAILRALPIRGIYPAVDRLLGSLPTVFMAVALLILGRFLISEEASRVLDGPLVSNKRIEPTA